MTPDQTMLDITTRPKNIKDKKKKKSLPGLDKAHSNFKRQTLREPENHTKTGKKL